MATGLPLDEILVLVRRTVRAPNRRPLVLFFLVLFFLALFFVRLVLRFRSFALGVSPPGAPPIPFPRVDPTPLFHIHTNPPAVDPQRRRR